MAIMVHEALALVAQADPFYHGRSPKTDRVALYPIFIKLRACFGKRDGFSDWINSNCRFSYSFVNSVISGLSAAPTPETPKAPDSTSPMGYVYQHAYQNGKSYVGQTRQKPDARWNAQYNEILSFIRAIPKKSIASLLEDLFKDAWERADRKVIDEVAFELLDLAERYHIAKIGTVYPRGYNETAGG